MPSILVHCPGCGGELSVDQATGEVLSHRARRDDAASKDFDALLADLDASKARAEAVFEKEKAAYRDRERLLEEKFREALKRAEEDPDDGPPLRPWDLD